MEVTMVLIFALALCGSFIQRVSGFGFGVFVMMFFPFIMTSLGEATMVSGLLSACMSLIVILKHWKVIRWKSIAVLLLTNIVISFVAINFMAGLGNDSLKQLLGILLIIISLYSLGGDMFKQLFYPRAASGSEQGTVKETEGQQRSPVLDRFLQVITGCISGVTGGMFGMPGPPVVVYCIETIKDKQAYVATLQAVFFTSNVFYSLFRLHAGFWTEATLSYWLAGVFGVLAGVWLGARFFEKISGPRLRIIVYCFMLVSGIVTLC